MPPERVVDPGGRDGCRAPIPWTPEPDHGWGVTDPWLPWPPDPSERNVERPSRRSRLDRPPVPAAAGRPDGVAGPPARRPGAGWRRPPPVVAWRRLARGRRRRPGRGVNLGTDPVAVDLAGTVLVSSDGAGEGEAFGGTLAGDTARAPGAVSRAPGRADHAHVRYSARRADAAGPGRAGRRLVGAGLEHQAALAVEGEGGVALDAGRWTGSPTTSARHPVAQPRRRSSSRRQRLDVGAGGDERGVDVRLPAELAHPGRHERDGRAAGASRRPPGVAAPARPRGSSMPALTATSSSSAAPPRRWRSSSPRTRAQVAPAARRPLGDGHDGQVRQHEAHRAVELAAAPLAPGRHRLGHAAGPGP